MDTLKKRYIVDGETKAYIYWLCRNRLENGEYPNDMRIINETLVAEQVGKFFKAHASKSDN
jgi:hypothetical protein